MNTASFWLRGLGTSVVLAVVCTSCGKNRSTMGTGVEGTITVSPIHPGPTRVDESNAAPLKHVAFAVENETGLVTSFETDELGKFRVSLKPGHYTIFQPKARSIRRCGPFEVDVAADGMTAVHWQCDSGMR